MRLARIDKALEDCESHLNDAAAWNTEIERLLTYSVLVIVYAELEQAIGTIVQEKYSNIANTSIRNFVESSRDVGSRSIMASELANFLGRFGDEYKSSFQERIREQARAETFYNNLITNRHSTSHSSGSNASFMDVKRFYEEGHIVLDFFRDTLLAPDHDGASGQRL